MEQITFQQMRAIMENVNGGVTAVLVRGGVPIFLYSNDHYYRLLGYTREQFAAEVRSAFDLIYEEDREAVIQQTLQASQHYENFICEYRAVRRDGSIVWMRSHVSITTLPGIDEPVQLAVANDISKQKDAEQKEREAVEQQKKMLENMPGGVGIYYFHHDNRLELVYLNEGYYYLIGTEREQRQAYGGLTTMNAVHPDDAEPLLHEIRTGIEKNRIINLDIRILCEDHQYKWVNIKAKVAAKTEEKYTLFVFFADIDQLKTTQLRLAATNGAVEIASKNNGISFWIYHIDDELISLDLQDASPLGYPHEIPNAQGYFETGEIVFPDDRAVFMEMYQKLRDGVENCDCTARLMNLKTGKYEWQHTFYTRLHHSSYVGRVAIGFAINVDLEQENRQRYERELQLRQEMISNSIIYYQINLSTGMIEEFYSRYHDIKGISSNTHVNEALRQQVLANVMPEDKERVYNAIFTDALIKAYSRGETSVTVVYRRHLSGIGVRWLKALATIMERPSTGELIAFIHSQNIDIERKDQLAIESIKDEEIEYVVLLNVHSGLAHFVQVKDFVGLKPHQVFCFDPKYEEIIRCQVMEEDQAECEKFFLMKHLVKKLQKEKIIKITYRIKNSDGCILRKKTRAFYLDDTREEIVLIRRDITDLYEEEQRQKQRLQSAVDAAVEANHAKSDFLSRMSHDMRTPLNAVLSFSDYEMMKGVSEDQLKVYLEKIHASGEYLLGIINDVLDVSKIEQEKMVLHPTPYSLDEFVENINTVIGSLCKEKRIEFLIDVSEAPNRWIKVDKIRFNQIFINLLSNAVKFTPGEGKIEFIVKPYSEVRTAGLQMQFEVRDNGIGMSPEFLPKAFESFAQEYHEDVSERTQGTGLGLTIVKEIITLMGGTISVESTQGKGTSFTVILPLLYTEPPAAAENFSDTENSLEGKRILLCEDNELNTEITVTLLEKQGCIVECAENGEQGLEMFQSSKEGYYDAVLMDIRMPVMNGLEATKAIRNSGHSDAAKIPIIAMTADAFSEDEQISSEAGMNAHLSKPVEPEKVFETLKRVMRK